MIVHEADPERLDAALCGQTRTVTRTLVTATGYPQQVTCDACRRKRYAIEAAIYSDLARECPKA